MDNFCNMQGQTKRRKIPGFMREVLAGNVRRRMARVFADAVK